jgi:hypothetical protein
MIYTNKQQKDVIMSDSKRDVRVMVDAHYEIHPVEASDKFPLGPLPNRQSTIVFLVKGVPENVDLRETATMVARIAGELYRQSVRHECERSTWTVGFEELTSLAGVV